VIHARTWRAVLQPLLELPDRVIRTDGQYFHPAVRQVACVSAHPEPLRLLAGAGAEKHPLHLAADDEARRLHPAHDGIGHAAGLGPPALAIAVSMSFAVTGPRKCFATLPSGAIR